MVTVVVPGLGLRCCGPCGGNLSAAVVQASQQMIFPVQQVVQPRLCTPSQSYDGTVCLTANIRPVVQSLQSEHSESRPKGLCCGSCLIAVHRLCLRDTSCGR